MTTHSSSIEALLFATADAYTVKDLATLLEISSEEVESALNELTTALEERGIMLVRGRDEVTLATKAVYAPLIEKVRKEELSKELTKAAAETLAVVCYHPNATKAEIELIRGVNATYSIRNLMMRGLIESEGTGRGTTYKPTLALLEHFGVGTTEGLPAYGETKAKIESLLMQNQELPQ